MKVFDLPSIEVKAGALRKLTEEADFWEKDNAQSILKELAGFRELLSYYRSLPTSFVRDIIMKAPSSDMMNTLARSVLTLYSYDDRADDTSLPNVLRQCLQLISLFPLLSIYGYQAYGHYHDGKSLFIHQPVPTLSTAENILHILLCSFLRRESNKTLDD